MNPEEEAWYESNLPDDFYDPEDEFPEDEYANA